jgi:NPCBM/NEW2 domain
MIRLGIAALLLIAAPTLGAERPFRYVAKFASGQRIESDRLTNWHMASALPQLGGTPLLDPANPLQWLINRARRLGQLPDAFVEFTNGDRLPGVVVDYRTGDEEPYHPQPPHLIVRVSVGFEPPLNKPAPEIRVLAQFVRRIVWQRRDQVTYQGGAAHYRDGRSVPLRAARFKSGEVHALLAEGDRQLDWDDLAELHLPAADPFTAWFDHLAAICPNGDERLLQLETATGLISTASAACFMARFEGNSADPDRWVHGIQPAWSLDILWVPFRDIAVYRSFAVNEIPLSRISHQRVTSGGGLGGPRTPRIDRSATGSALSSSELEFGWGFGVAGGSELTIELPAAARSLRTSVCLDRTVEAGGCVRPRMFLDDQGRRLLWEGPVLVGSRTVADSGRLVLQPQSGERRKLVLQVDAMLTNRPPGADPLDIRDHADWCDPLLELDAEAVQSELDSRLARRFVAWREWSVESGSSGRAKAGIEITLQANDAVPGSFEPAIHASRQPLVLRRELTIGPHDRWLVIGATRVGRRLPEPKIDVLIDGQVVRTFTPPMGGSDLKDVSPLVVPLAALRSETPRTHSIEIRQLADNGTSALQYWSVAVSEQLPTLQALLEDDAIPTPIDAQQAGTATLVDSDGYPGQRSLKLTPAAQFRVELPAAIPVRATPKWGEARFIRLAVRKTGGGRVAVEFEDARPRDESARYDLGAGPPSYGKSVRIWQEPLPGEWVVVTRDLYADFGEIDVKSLVVGCPDGEAALIDHVYLARTRADFDLVNKQQPGN